MTSKLPSQLPSHVTRSLDESFARGFGLGRDAGLEAAMQIIREMPYSASNMKLIEMLHNEKYNRHDAPSL